MKVYVVTYEENCGESGVERVFTDKEAAVSFCRLRIHEARDEGHIVYGVDEEHADYDETNWEDDWRVEEWEADGSGGGKHVDVDADRPAPDSDDEDDDE